MGRRYTTIGQAERVRSALELRSPSNGTGWSDRWSFSGVDDRLLRESLAQLAAFATPPPKEDWSLKARRHILAEDRWRAAMLLWPDEPTTRHMPTDRRCAEAAWTADGALALAELLPDRLADLRDGILARF
jgi:hypothetical protein